MLASVSVLWFAWVPTAAAAEGWEGKLSGTYKNLGTISETFLEKDRYWLDLNRLRLKGEFRYGRHLRGEVRYDQEFLFGSYLKTAEFAGLKARPSSTYLDLDRVYVDRSSLQARHLIYRAFVTYSAGPVDVTVGRQRIAWGTGRFWNPTDLLNPFNPLQIERDERQGVDAVLGEVSLGPLTRVSAVYAPQRRGRRASGAVKVRTTVGSYDLSLMAGRFAGSRVVGADFSGYVGDGGLRGEATYTKTEEGRSYGQAVLSADYTFPSSLYLMAELYYNGAGEGDPLRYDRAGQLSGEVISLARHYAGLWAGYDLTPLWRLDAYAVINLDDNSAVLNPVTTYNVRRELDVFLGAQFFLGPRSSEYGFPSHLYYGGLQRYF